MGSLILHTVLAAAAPAADEAAGGLYMGWGWLLFFFVCVCFWLYMTSWVANDAIGLGLKHQLWSSYMMAAGVVPLLLVLLTHVLVSLLMVVSVCVVFGAYVNVRNQVAPEVYKLFTKAHVQRILVRLRLRKADDAEIKVAPTGKKLGRSISIRITNPDGVSLDTVAHANPTFGDSVYDLAELLERAVGVNATAIQFEPRPAEFAVRARIDGILHNFPSYDVETGRLMLAFTALLSGITNVEGKKVSPTGKFFVHPPQRDKIEIAVNPVKTAAGPTLALKLPDPTAELHLDGLEKLGMFKSMIQRHRDLIRGSKNGLILLAGPAQSGKTTSLYASLQEVDVYVNTIVMVEERQEHEVDQITRATYDVSKGELFDKVLAKTLREDPNVVIIGEIKDKATATLACETAGERLVLSTIQADDAAAAISRMVAFGATGQALSQALLAVLAQRLVRLLCSDCRTPFEPPPELIAKLKIDPEKPGTWFEAGACPACAQIGFRGRTGLFEFLLATPEIKQAIVKSTPPDEKLIRALARKGGTKSMQEDGLKKVTLGATSLKELYRATAGK